MRKLDKPLVGILLAGLFLRLIFIPFDGFHNDVQTFEAWTLTLRDLPMHAFYARAGFADYPPGYLYVLAFLAKIYAVIGKSDVSYGLLHALVKLPAVACDLVDAVLVYMLVKRYTPDPAGRIAAAAVALNPAFIFISGYWGQVDSVAAVFILLGLLAIDRVVRGVDLMLWTPLAWLALAVSVLIKPPALVLVPLFVAATFVTRERAAITRRAQALGVGMLVAIALVYLLSLPFAPHASPMAVVSWLIERYRFGSNVYPYNSINAFNLYAINQPFWTPDNVRSALTFGLTQAQWGATLVVIIASALAVRAALVAESSAFIEAAMLATLSFFIFATRMHERYVFDAVLLAIVLAGIVRRYRTAAIVLTMTLFCNLAYSLAYLAIVVQTNSGYDARNIVPWLSRPCAFAATLVCVVYLLQYVGVFSEAARVRQGAYLRAVFGRLLSFTNTAPKIAGDADPNEVELPSLQTLYEKVRVRALRFDSFEGTRGFTKLDAVLCAGFTIFAFVISIIHYTIPAERIFDEIYYARSGVEYLKGIEQFEWTHPPLTKLIITLSMLIFGGLDGGDSSAGWRFLNVVIGALMVGVIYTFAKRLSGSTLCASIAAALLSLDGFRLAQSRIATPEITVAFFSLLVLYAFFRLWTVAQGTHEYPLTPKQNRVVIHGVVAAVCLVLGVILAHALVHKNDPAVPSWLAPLLIVGYVELAGYLAVRLFTSSRSDQVNRWLLILSLCGGALAASKWNGLFDFFVVWGIAGAVAFQSYMPALRESFALTSKAKPKGWGDPKALSLDLLIGSMVFVAATVYVISYIPYFSLGHGFVDLLVLQHSMYAYHADLRATHPYASQWWQWPLLQRPISYYYHDFRVGAARSNVNACCVAEILALPNPVTWWFGLITVPAIAAVGWLEKRKGYLLLAVAYLVQWLPWIASPRIAFEYHFFPNLAIICLCDALVIWRLILSAKAGERWKSWQWETAAALGVLVVYAFVYWYPITAGTGLSYSAWYDRTLSWFPLVHWI